MPLSASDAPAGSVEFLGEIAHVSYPGGTWRHAVRLGDSLVNVDAPEAFPPGHAVRIRVSHQSLFLFSVASQKAAPPHSSALLEVSEP
ncbi:hypothetical protein [Tianweitania sediminis]|uniref:hypothetical protein n=1 Tax=Tianweitania sediminis TaxID=1502156 RepID=UPI001FD82143|nr:hypothetical protein [Tianweitania sediminis]